MRINNRLHGLVLALTASLAFTSVNAQNKIDIPFEKFKLDNGLTVIVHEDRKAPIVAINVWYHVGSGNEVAGKTGFAHLFEHLMFQGSENAPGEFFAPFELVGATNMNGTTNVDRTNYFENVPTTAVDMALFLESDRMGHFLGAVTQELLDEQRGVVQNEKRQGENQPYGKVRYVLPEAMYPKGHPYSWTTIGSMEDLNAASLDDVKQWFKDWYGPNNAVLVLAGDIDVATAKQKVQKYFGHIPASPPVTRRKVWIAERIESTRDVMQDRVAQTRLYRTWNVPQYGSRDIDLLAGFAQVLGGSKTSRLSKRLIHQEQLVDSVYAYAYGQELSGTFQIGATIKTGVDVEKVEAIIQQELEKLIAEGPSKAEMEQARIAFKAGFIRGVERIGGFGGKADALAECEVFTGNPNCFRDSLDLIDSASAAQITASGKRWLARGDHTLLVVPQGELKVAATAVDRSKGTPQVSEFPDLIFPDLQRDSLPNGVKIVLAERHDIPVVQMSMQFSGGYAGDHGRKLGTSSFTLSMLDEGAGKLNALQLSEKLDAIGAQVGGGAGLDDSSVYLSALKEKLDESVALYADVIRAPLFEQNEIERVRKTWIAGIAQEKTRPNSIAMRLLPPLMYGSDHVYGIPLSGTGTESSIQSLTREDLVQYHQDFVRPDNAVIVVVGDTTMAETKSILSKYFGDWKAPESALPVVNVAAVALPTQPRVFLVDQPGAVQANILVGQLVASTKDAKALEFDTANEIFGGAFTARLNTRLREEKHWSYGAYSFATGAVGQRSWIGTAGVQIDKTAPSIAEMRQLLTDYSTGVLPATEEELNKVKANNVRGMPGQYETAGAVMGTISGMIRYQRPDDYVQQLKTKTEEMPLAEVNEAAKVVHLNALTWVIVGDLSKIEQEVRDLNLGEVKIMDADGKILR